MERQKGRTWVFMAMLLAMSAMAMAPVVAESRVF
jgi:hypothetical protein